MWDIEAFAIPPLRVLQPKAAEALLAYRSDKLPAARRNAQVMGRRGLQFPWESAPGSGEEAAPFPARPPGMKTMSRSTWRGPSHSMPT
jgi:trehalose/maltose hydrolase-like predicted phosphorylase